MQLHLTQSELHNNPLNNRIMYTVDFQKEYKTNYGETITVIVVKDSDDTPYVFKEREVDGRYYYSRDEYYIATWDGFITERLTIDQLMYEDDLPDNLFWSHP